MQGGCPLLLELCDQHSFLFFFCFFLSLPRAFRFHISPADAMDRAKTLQELTVREGSSKSSGILSALIEGLPGVGLRRVGGWSRRLRYEGPGSAGAAGILRRRSGCSEAFITSPCVGWISLRAADGNWCVQPGNAVNEVPPATAMKKPFYIFRKVGPGWASVLLMSQCAAAPRSAANSSVRWP